MTCNNASHRNHTSQTVPVGTGAADLRLTDLELDSGGRPGRALSVLYLDRLDASHAAAVAESITGSAGLIVGVIGESVSKALNPVVEAATVTLSASPYRDRRIVTVDDVDIALDTLAAAVEHAPCAAVACGQLLRQTPSLPTVPALAAEASTYSMLLGGKEFADWLSARGPARAAPAPDELVRIDRVADALTITLDHPRRRNALSTRMREELLAAVEVAIADPTVGSVRLRGNGPAFCSGGDLDEFGCATDPVAAYLVRMDRAPWRLLDRLSDRLLIETHGACVGAGAEIAAFGGIVTAAPGTWFRFPEVDMGLVPGAGGTVSVPRRIGRWRAAWAMLTGCTVDTDTALRWGLVDRIEHPAQEPRKAQEAS
ncbi:MAG: enoyl-CoA hydratase/isomerase family protein [Nocardia sp.]|nr:enoyl-CoA hydratase/isomerase family protein [Nocardia sp.]